MEKNQTPCLTALPHNLQRVTARRLALVALLTSVLTLVCASQASAQDDSRIRPVASVAPTVLPAGQVSSVFISVSNANPASTSHLMAGDVFRFTFDPSAGAELRLEGRVLLNSPALAAEDFKARLRGNRIIITYTGESQPFGPGDSFGVNVALRAPDSIGTGKVTCEGPLPGRVAEAHSLNERYASSMHTFTPVSFGEPSTNSRIAGLSANGLHQSPPSESTGAVVAGAGAAPQTGAIQPQAVGINAGLNPLQVATLRWHEVNQLGPRFNVGTRPFGIAFDGASIWVANGGGNTVTKLRASDGALLGTFAVGSGPKGIAFDGANIWVANSISNTVTKLRASDGATLGTFAAGLSPYGIAFDGENVWVTSNGGNTVAKLRAETGYRIGDYVVGYRPTGIAFDGSHIWVAIGGSNTVTRLRAGDGAFVYSYLVGSNPQGIAFDGTNIWVVHSGLVVSGGYVTRLRPSDASQFVAYTIPVGAADIVFDGANVWVTSNQSNDAFMTKLRTSDGFKITTFRIGSLARGVCFDGANIWVVSEGTNSVSKR